MHSWKQLQLRFDKLIFNLLITVSQINLGLFTKYKLLANYGRKKRKIPTADIDRYFEESNDSPSGYIYLFSEEDLTKTSCSKLKHTKVVIQLLPYITNKSFLGLDNKYLEIPGQNT